MNEEYRKQAVERAKLGIPPLPLNAQQTAELCEILKNPPADLQLLDSYMNNKSISKSDRPLEVIIAQERLRQAKYSFNLALTAIALSLIISVVGAVLLLSDKVPQGSVTYAVGLVSSVQSVKFAREVNERLD